MLSGISCVPMTSDDVSGVGTQLVCLVLNESTSIILKQVIERLR